MTENMTEAELAEYYNQTEDISEFDVGAPGSPDHRQAQRDHLGALLAGGDRGAAS